MRVVTWLRGLLIAALGVSVLAQAPTTPAAIEAFGKLLVQDGGRVKPLHTYAYFTLLQLNSRGGCKTSQGEDSRSLTPVQWLLDTWFAPESSQHYRAFVVSNDEVLTAIGVEHLGRNKRDRYSYADLAPARLKLFEMGATIENKPKADRTVLEQQTLYLAYAVRKYELHAHAFDFARQPMELPSHPVLRRTFPEGRATLLQILDSLTKIRAEVAGAEREAAEREVLTDFLGDVERRLADALPLRVLPAVGKDPEHSTWLAAGDLAPWLMMPGDHGQEVTGRFSLLSRFAELAVTKDPASFEAKSLALVQDQLTIARDRGEGLKAGTEIAYHKGDFTYRALYCFVLGFLLCALLWLKPNAKWMYWTANAAVAVGTGLLVTGIVLRCVVLSRAPVSTLYETIPFVTGVALIVGLAVEWIQRNRIALPTIALLGAAGMYLTASRELFDAAEEGDTMVQLVAVLNSNFWLSTHVTTITIGYGAGLLAGAIAHVFVLAKLCRWWRDEPQNYRSLTRMIYGVTCFGLLFAVVGTILGGIWANDSWGRFWGWDPKENGALMICLAQLAMLHGRMGGLLKGWGLTVAAILTGGLVAFSWWGVNLLGIGLHSYGFTQGAGLALITFYLIETVVLLLALVAWLRDRAQPSVSEPHAKPSPSGHLAPSS